MQSQTTETIWIVVLVESGVTTQVEAYRDKTIAFKRAQALKGHVSENDDDVAIFEGEVGTQSFEQLQIAGQME